MTTTDRAPLVKAITEVVERMEGECGDAGDAWLRYWNPDSAYLDTHSLIDALVDAVSAVGAA